MAKVHVSIAVDWEGEHFRDLDDLRATRAAIQASLGSQVPFTHFICPTYWLQGDRLGDPAKAIRSVLMKGDEVGLHVHCWKELVSFAGVQFMSSPDWNNDGTGHGVPLGAYGERAQEILAGARKLLTKRLGVTVNGFRCGGAMTSDCVFEALMELGFKYDCSAFPPEVVSKGFRKGSRGNLRDTSGARTEIAGFLVDLWGHESRTSLECANGLSLRANAGQGITPRTQPYRVRSNGRSILEMPGNGGISDYASAGYMTKAFDKLLAMAGDSEEPLFFNIGCHQEGAGRWKKPLMDFCHTRRRELSSDAVVVMTVAKAARVSLAAMCARGR